MTGPPPAWLPYSDDIEVKWPQEEEHLGLLLESFTRINRLLLDPGRLAISDGQAQHHALLKGELRILPDLPAPLAQGLFQREGRHPVLLRLSSAPGNLGLEAGSCLHGVALKVLGVEGPKVLAREAEALTQDFLFVNLPAIPEGAADTYLRQQLKLEAVAGPGEARPSTFLRDTTATLPFNAGVLGPGQPLTHILGDTFYSLAALRHGDYVAKLGLFPVSENLAPLRGRTFAASQAHALRDAVAGFFAHEGAEYELRAQLCTDLVSMPVEDGRVRWPESRSPYQPVARLVLAPQASDSPARQRCLQDTLTFNPWHCLPAHRPLGSLMRVRRKAYELKAPPHGEPRTLEELPD
jgi:hypothetical protein